MTAQNVHAAYHALMIDIARIASENGRAVDDVTLVAVSKTQPADAILELAAAGQRVFGENRVQEAMEKFAPIRATYPDISLHMVGHLQTNKAKEAVATFDVIESIDSERLADAVAAEMKKQARYLPCFIQVNTGDEDQKNGVSPDDADALLAHCRDIGIEVIGLMCIPPVHEPAAFHFALLHDMAGRMGLKHLSMGMSGDYEDAILFGATHVRIGSALFGTRAQADNA